MVGTAFTGLALNYSPLMQGSSQPPHAEYRRGMVTINPVDMLEGFFPGTTPVTERHQRDRICPTVVSCFADLSPHATLNSLFLLFYLRVEFSLLHGCRSMHIDKTQLEIKTSNSTASFNGSLRQCFCLGFTLCV